MMEFPPTFIVPLTLMIEFGSVKLPSTLSLPSTVSVLFAMLMNPATVSTFGVGTSSVLSGTNRLLTNVCSSWKPLWVSPETTLPIVVKSAYVGTPLSTLWS